MPTPVTSTAQKSEATQSFFIFVRDANSGQITSVAIPGDVQIGLNGNPADMTLLGRFSVAAKNYDVTFANKGIIQSSPDDTIIGVSLITTPLSQRISLYLSQSPREGELHFVKDLTGTSNTVPIDIFPTTGFTIDGMAKVTLSDPTASLALVFLNGNWYRLVAGLGTSGGSGAPNTLSYVTINPEAALTSERHLTGSVNIMMTDHGAKSTVNFDLSQILGAGAGTFSYATVTADAWGRITSISANLPPVTAISGTGATTVSAAGSVFTVNSPVSTGSLGVIFNDTTAYAKASIDPSYFVAEGSISIFTAPNGNLIISGSTGINPGQFAPPTAEYLLLALTGSLPDARLISAGTGISFVDSGPNNIFQISINNNVVATLSGSRFTGPVTGALGIVATGVGPGQGFSGSLQLLSDGKTPYLVGIGSVTVTSSSSGQVVISGSGGSQSVTAVTGAGGSSVSHVGSVWTVSSSNGADLYASYLLVSGSAEDVNARQLLAGSNVTFVDTGPGGSLTINAIASGAVGAITGAGGTSVTSVGGNYTISSSVYADPQAAYLLVVSESNSQDPNARTLLAGSNIIFSDAGPGGAFTISSTGGGGATAIPAASPAVAYNGYCTGSINWGNNTAWTDFTTIITNFTESLSSGITRSGATWTVNTTGLYHWHSDFNVSINAGFVAFRLSGSNGELLQVTTYDGNTATPAGRLDGIISLNSGSSFKLQYVRKTGTAAAWSSSDPIGTSPDTENMHTGEVNMFLINPLSVTINQQLSASVTGWATAVDIPFDAQPNQTFTGNSTVNIFGYTFTQLNPGNASAAAVVNGTGVQWTNGAADDIFGGTFSAPALTIQLQSLFSNYSLPDHNVRLWWWINQDNPTTNYEGASFGLTLGGTTTGFSPTTFNITNKKGYFGSQLGYNPQLNASGTNFFNIDLAGFETYNVMMLQYDRNGRYYAWYIGSGSIVNGVDVWPTTNQMQQLFAGDVNIGSSELYVGQPITGSGNPAMFMGLASTTGRALVESYRRFRLDYLTPNNVLTGLGSLTLTGSFVPPDSSDYLWWPCNDTQGPYVLNYGSAGAIGNLTASAASVHYNQVGPEGGPYGTAVATNTNGIANNYLGILNTATQPTPATSSITLSAWFRPENATTTNHQKIVHKSYYNTTSTWSSPYETLAIALAGAGNGLIEFDLAIGGGGVGPVLIASGASCTANSWNHAGLTYDGVFIRGYLNGVLVTQVAQTGPIDYSGNGWWAIGGNQAIPTTEYFQGQIADVRVANTVRSNSWFAQVWQSGRPWANAQMNLIISGVLQQIITSSGGGSSFIASGAYSGPNAWVEQGFSPLIGTTQIKTTSSVSIAGDQTDADDHGPDIFVWVSGTIAGTVGGSSPAKSVFGGDVVISGSLNVQGPLAITGSITQMPNGNPYIIGLGGTQILTNSLGQIVVSSSKGSGGGGGAGGIYVQNQGATLPASPYSVVNFAGAGVSTSDVGGIATVTIPGGQPGLVPGAFAIYNGFTTASIWFDQTGSYTNITEALNGGTINDRFAVNMLRNGAVFTFLQTGFYRVRADFNVSGSNGFVTLQFSGSGGDLLERSTFVGSPPDHAMAVLDGIVQVNSGDIYTLQYVASGTLYPWLSSNPLVDGDNMHTGEIDIFLIPSGTATVTNYSITASAGAIGNAPANYFMVSGTNSFIFGTSPAGWQNVTGLSGTITTQGYPVLLMANICWTANTAGAQAAFSIARDGVNIGSPFWGMQAAGPTSQGYNNNASFAFVDFGATSGVNHTYTLIASGAIGTGQIGAWGVGPNALMAFEMVRANVVTGSTTLTQAVPGGNLTYLSASIFVNRGPVLVIQSTNQSSDSGGSWAWTDVYRNGSSLANGAGQGLSVNVGSNTNEIQGCCTMVLDQGANLGATNTYVSRATNGGGSNHVNTNGVLSSIILWELTDVNYKYSFSTSQITPSTIPTYSDIDPQNPTAGLITRGRPVLLVGTINSNTSGNGRNGYSFFRNGVNVITSSKGMQIADGEGNSDWNKMPTLFWIDNYPTNNAGFYNYQLMGTVVSSSAFTAQGSYTYLFMYELDAGGPGTIVGGWLDEGNLLFTTSSIQALGNANFGGNLTVGGNSTVGGNQQIGGNLQVSGSGTSTFFGNVTIDGLLTFASGSGMAITGSSVGRQLRIPLLSAMVTSPQYLANKANLGVNYFDPTKFNKGIDALKFIFRALFQPVFGTGNAYVDLYDYNGIVTGTPAVVSGSVLTASLASGLNTLFVDLTTVLSGVTGSGIFLARGWADPSGSNYINVGGVELDVEWQ